MKSILSSEAFNADTDIFIIKKPKEGKDHLFSTYFTLLDLEYDTQDVINTLSNLTVDNYSETVFDKDDNNPILLHVFGKEINSRMVYIKLKIRETDRKCIICVSFHYAKKRIVFPYR